MAGCLQQRSRTAAIPAYGTAAVEAGHCQCRSHRLCLFKYISCLSFDHEASLLHKCMTETGMRTGAAQHCSETSDKEQCSIHRCFSYALHTLLTSSSLLSPHRRCSCRCQCCRAYKPGSMCYNRSHEQGTGNGSSDPSCCCTTARQRCCIPVLAGQAKTAWKAVAAAVASTHQQQ